TLAMAFRRALSIRSTLTSLRKQLPSYHIIIRENNHAEDSFTSQRISEVGVAASDSFLPIAALQHCIDMLMRPRLESIREEMQSKGMDHVTMAEGQKKMKNLFKEYGVTPFTPMKGMLIQGPLFICFFLAIRNMAEKVPSFQTGGALWFTDLTTPDSLYILPVLTALTFLITVERPRVKKLLKIPELPPPPPGQQPSFDLFAALKKMKAMTQDRTQNEIQAPSPVVNPRLSSLSPVSKRLKALESQVKGRKKNSSKKR
ncbi:hypothetical protein HID58_093603, partial [Brassica napus]